MLFLLPTYIASNHTFEANVNVFIVCSKKSKKRTRSSYNFKMFRTWHYGIAVCCIKCNWSKLISSAKGHHREKLFGSVRLRRGVKFNLRVKASRSRTLARLRHKETFLRGLFVGKRKKQRFVETEIIICVALSVVQQSHWPPQQKDRTSVT